MLTYEIIQIEGIIFNAVPQNGALVVYCKRKHKGKNAHVNLNGDYKNQLNVQIAERRVNGRNRYVAVFPSLPQGSHTVAIDWVSGSARTVSIFPGHVSEVEYT